MKSKQTIYNIQLKHCRTSKVKLTNKGTNGQTALSLLTVPSRALQNSVIAMCLCVISKLTTPLCPVGHMTRLSVSRPSAGHTHREGEEVPAYSSPVTRHLLCHGSLLLPPLRPRDWSGQRAHRGKGGCGPVRSLPVFPGHLLYVV